MDDANMKMETSGGGMGKMIGRMFSGKYVSRTVIQQKADLDRLHTLPVFQGSIAAFKN